VTEISKPIIWIDADACPKIIKEVIYSISGRLQLEVVLVANSSMFIPPSPLIRLIKVSAGADVADSYIVEHVSSNDIVITADIPLAAFIVEKNAIALNVRGEVYTEENVRERLSMRDFMKDLRDSTGMEIGGPDTFGPKDKEKFTNSINRILEKKLSASKRPVQK
jgi:uncharacterized protein YaiI (UPF0178 family)